MADPIIVFCPKNVWTKVLEKKKVCRVDIKDYTPSDYIYTNKDNPAAAPTGGTYGIKVRNRHFYFDSDVDSDIYVKPIDADGLVQVGEGWSE